MTASSSEFDYPVYQLMIGEIISWPAGVCEITAHRQDGEQPSLYNQPDHLTVVGENRHPVETIHLTGSKEPAEVDRQLAEAVKQEQDSL